ncbi:M20/M25/M40 family metallo-hydrolase [Xinfangfangia sp. CPCC 101601]|uniref:M20/M25/M40 family metallo-hydrolase n=1 Tax=Pseudogemmobacter lacusdianii TaxID=3069608 RepID=A0ABU0W290_9RHOB|nr:M20/M25/M40 family metallo-hydrolase [Xinfangfangia sp. CPCC 101601]MDQ2068139.1 M20/M25/M40 family metallo-hydrolase [Xinfangfangia sp. CPCC 101601]
MSTDQWNVQERAAQISHDLVSWNSEGGLQGEADFAMRLRDYLLEIPYFRENPDDITIYPAYGQPQTYNLLALVRGTGKRTLGMAGHYDTVSIQNYHELAHLACDPVPLREALIADLASRSLSEQEARALADFQGGDFVPGRGMLDMKSGLAAGIALIEHFSTLEGREGNLLFMTTPDEERESRGMRALREDLPGYLAARGLELDAAINLDATSDQGDGALGRAVYEGTIGKLLPFAYVIGQSSHVSYPFEGISAQLIGAEILRGIEGNTNLADAGGGDVAPPPICLEARDTRNVYEVTTPERFWLSFNWLFQSGTAEDRFTQFRAEVEAALTRATEAFRKNAAAYGALIQASPGASTGAARVITLAELRATALADAAAEKAFADCEASLAGIDNPLELSRRLTEWLANAALLKGPCVVIGFAGLHYPPSRLDPADPRAADLLAAIEKAEAWAVAAEQPHCRRPYFQGISDMSFLGQPKKKGADVVAQNTPAARLVDEPSAEALGFPTVNIGPWGREFHQRLERVHGPYAFGILPKVLKEIAIAFLAPKA